MSQQFVEEAVDILRYHVRIYGTVPVLTEAGPLS